MGFVEESFAIIDDALLVLGVVLILLGQWAGLIAIALGITWKFIEGEVSFSEIRSRLGGNDSSQGDSGMEDRMDEQGEQAELTDSAREERQEAPVYYASRRPRGIRREFE